MYFRQARRPWQVPRSKATTFSVASLPSACDWALSGTYQPWPRPVASLAPQCVQRTCCTVTVAPGPEDSSDGCACPKPWESANALPMTGTGADAGLAVAPASAALAARAAVAEARRMAPRYPAGDRRPPSLRSTDDRPPPGVPAER